MSRPIDPGKLELLRWLDRQADELRRELHLYQRDEFITWYMSEHDPERFFKVIADGYGQLILIDYKGPSPADHDVLNQQEYDDEDAACRAVWRLGECGVDWVERDIELGDHQYE
jgi:hypothetical protein